MAYIEFAALFYALAEEARSLNKGQDCPASAKTIWIQLSLDFSDSGYSSTAIKVQGDKIFKKYQKVATKTIMTTSLILDTDQH